MDRSRGTSGSDWDEKITFDRLTLDLITGRMRKEKHREEGEDIEEKRKKKCGRGREETGAGSCERQRNNARDADGSFPGDVHGRRVPWRAAGRVHGVFRVVLRRTNGAGTAVP